jgi:hypothetical protein
MRPPSVVFRPSGRCGPARWRTGGSGRALRDSPPARLPDLAARRRPARPARTVRRGGAPAARGRGLGRRDRRRPRRHGRVQRGLRRAAGDVGQLRGRRRPPGRSDHPRRVRRPRHHPCRRQRAGPAPTRRPEGLVRAPGRRGRRIGDGLRWHHPGRAPRGLAGARGRGCRDRGRRRHRVGHEGQQAGPSRLGRPVPPGPAAPVATGRSLRAPDDSDVGWGERPGDPSDDDRRYVEDRPPHWGSD